MNIFIVTETLLAGGAEWFVLRLCEALSKQGHSVKLFILRPDLVDERLTKHFMSIEKKHASLLMVKMTVLCDRILHKLGFTFSCTERLNSRYIKNHIEQSRPDALHSHLLPCDLTVLRANKNIGIRHISTIHGDYIQGIKNKNERMEKNIRKAGAALDSVVVISDEQAKILGGYSKLFEQKISKVYNGYPEPDAMTDSSRDGTFNFGIIARGIPEKGWEQTIKAFTRIKHPSARLYLYGESPFLKQLESKYTDPRIIFAGFSEQPLKAIGNLHVGLLPSYYIAESLPTTIIEYLAMSKPVIVSSIGEIPRMIETETRELAGIIVDSKEPEEMIEPIYEAMSRLMIDSDLYEKMAFNCESAFKKFSMDKCVDAYLSVYETETLKVCVA